MLQIFFEKMQLIATPIENLIQYFKQIKYQSSDESQENINHLHQSQICISHLGCFFINNNQARKILCLSMYGNTIKKNKNGNHSVSFHGDLFVHKL